MPSWPRPANPLMPPPLLHAAKHGNTCIHARSGSTAARAPPQHKRPLRQKSFADQFSLPEPQVDQGQGVEDEGRAFDAVGPHTGKTDAKRKVKNVIEAVSQKLGNTPTICRKCYVHPRVIDTYLAGSLAPGQLHAAAADTSNTLLAPEEHALLRFLRTEPQKS